MRKAASTDRDDLTLMPLSIDYPIQKSSSRLRLQFLQLLRWLAIAGQLLTIYVVAWILGFKFNWAICLGLIAISIWLNIVLRMFHPARTRLSPKFATVLLLYDVVSVSALLYMTGGLQNPFAFMLITPVVIAAATLPMDRTILLGIVVLLCLGFVAWMHEPLPWFPGQKFELPIPYRFALAASIIVSMIYVSTAAYLISTETRRMSSALAATETVLAREQQLNALDGLAAAAAHELGTPLGTIYVTSKEILRELEGQESLAEDLRLISSQAERCRRILTKLTRSPGESDALLKTLALSDLVNEAAEPFAVSDIAIELITEELISEMKSSSPEPVCNRNPGVIYGLGNLIENAFDFAEDRVSITASWTEKDAYIVVADDGPGFPPEILDTLGDPFVTTRSATTTSIEASDGSGLGLGFFIAKTLLERSGATLTLANRLPPDHGAVIRIHWPRAEFEPKDGRNDMVEDENLSLNTTFEQETLNQKA